jgi:hypothetical protein
VRTVNYRTVDLPIPAFLLPGKSDIEGVGKSQVYLSLSVSSWRKISFSLEEMMVTTSFFNHLRNIGEGSSGFFLAWLLQPG